MMNNMQEIYKHALLDATLTLAYVIGIAVFLTHGAPQVFTETPNGEGKGILIPIFMLLTLIVSASITGYLVLGKPILWYWDGRKHDAFRLFFTTIAVLALFMIGAMVVSALLR